MPGEPRDARRSDVITLVLWPVGVPDAVGRLADVQALSRGSPQAFVSREPVEVMGREFPGRIELADEKAAGWVRGRVIQLSETILEHPAASTRRVCDGGSRRLANCVPACGVSAEKPFRISRKVALPEGFEPSYQP